jgi:hypothetical protein
MHFKNFIFRHKNKFNPLLNKTISAQRRRNSFCVSIKTIVVCLLWTTMQKGIAQTVPGPCGVSITVTNASSPTATDGKFVITGITGSAVYMRYGIVGAEMYADGTNLSNATRVLTGLGAGTYNFRIYKDVGGVYNCGETSQTITIGANTVAACAGTEIGGTVFNDANANGINDVGEQGAAGITINAYNNAGTLAATQTSGVNGIYKFTGLATGQTYRMEYVWADSYLKSGAAGTGSGTSVQFINSGSCTANFGVNFPPNYCQTQNPYVMTPCYINGDPQAAAVGPLDVMVTFPYRAANFDFGVAGRTTAPTHVARANEIGATWAVAYQKTTKYAFTSATMRRFAGFGPLGTGGIYKVNMTTPTAPVVSNWINAKLIGINTGNDTRNGTPANKLSTAPGSPTWDAEAFNQVGKVGMGGMDFNERGDSLWLINLADRKLYVIKNVNPSTTPVATDVVGAYPVVLPTGYSYLTNVGDFRPWAVKFYKGLVYVGAVCSGESTPWDRTKIKAYVLSFNPANPAAGFSFVAEMPLNYNRFFYGGTVTENFNTWITNASTQNYTWQPMATDIEFDLDGSLVLALGDRGSMQVGNQNYPADPTATNTSLNEGNTFGDIVRFCKSGATFIKEGNAGCPYPTVNPLAYQEYYWGDGGPSTGGIEQFNDIAVGGLALLAGSSTILSTAQDPYSYYAGGTMALSNISGGDKWRYVVYDNTTPGASGKAAGLGDLELLCDPAPIEIGNRVWVDADGDGLQDANEVGLANITIDLYKAGVFVTSTTTDAYGSYKFTGLLANTAYEIRVALSQVNLNARPLATANVGTNDFIDSDMTGNGTGVIALTTGNFGDNNHSYDIGFGCVTTISAFGSNACVGGTATLNASGNSAGGTYNWTGVNGFTSSAQNPTIPNVPLLNSGSYSVTFTAFDRCTAGSTIAVNVNPVVSISAQPTAISECVGGNLTMSVTASGGFPPLTYQWESSPNGTTWTAISGATSTTFTPPSLAAATIYYHVIVSSTGGLGCNPATSNAVTATVVADPIVNITVPSTTVCTGGNITLSATPVGGIGTCTTQWQSSSNGGTTWSPIAGATSNTYNITLNAGLKYRAQLTCTGSGCCN